MSLLLSTISVTPTDAAGGYVAYESLAELKNQDISMDLKTKRKF